jgi:hypothetical protein
VCPSGDQATLAWPGVADTFLDAAVLAAEQVQDVRLQALEQPAELSGWDLWVQLAILLALESNIAGALIKWACGSAVKGFIKSNTYFLSIAGSRSGKQLAQAARDVASGKRRIKGASTARAVLGRGIPSRAIPGVDSKESLKLYNETLQRMVRRGTESDIDLANAVAQAAGKLKETGLPRRNDPLPQTDSAGVSVLSAAQEYARITRLGIRIRHDRIEGFVRREATPADLATVIDVVGWEPLQPPGQGSDVALSLTELRNKYRLLFEALIWARMYGFSEREPKSPNSWLPKFDSNDAAKPFPDIKLPIQDYWFRRFEGAAAEHARVKPGFGLVGRLGQAERVHRYFTAISTELASDRVGLKSGELSALVRPASGP